MKPLRDEVAARGRQNRNKMETTLAVRLAVHLTPAQSRSTEDGKLQSVGEKKKNLSRQNQKWLCSVKTDRLSSSPLQNVRLSHCGSLQTNRKQLWSPTLLFNPGHTFWQQLGSARAE